MENQEIEITSSKKQELSLVDLLNETFQLSYSGSSCRQFSNKESLEPQRHQRSIIDVV
jgi:hypothetical protein